MSARIYEANRSIICYWSRGRLEQTPSWCCITHSNKQLWKPQVVVSKKPGIEGVRIQGSNINLGNTWMSARQNHENHEPLTPFGHATDQIVQWQAEHSGSSTKEFLVQSMLRTFYKSAIVGVWKPPWNSEIWTEHKISFQPSKEAKIWQEGV